jgi:hypothetical protein
LGHRLLTGPQQLQQAAAIGLRDRSHQVSHLNTLASANALSKRPLPAKVMTAGVPRMLSVTGRRDPGQYRLGRLLRAGRRTGRGDGPGRLEARVVDGGGRAGLGLPSKRLVARCVIVALEPCLEIVRLTSRAAGAPWRQ